MTTTTSFERELRSTLTIERVTAYDAGMYMCVAGNSLGTGRPEFAWLTLHEPAVVSSTLSLSHLVSVAAGSVCVLLVVALVCLLLCVYRDREANRKRRVQQTHLVYGKTIRVVDDASTAEGGMLTPPKVQIDYHPESMVNGYGNGGSAKTTLLKGDGGATARTPVKYVLPDEWHSRWEVAHEQ